MLCPLCGKYPVTPAFCNSQKTIVRCQCGLIMLNPQPPQLEIRSFFDGGYISSAEGFQSLSRSRMETLKREAEIILSRKAGGQILDIGCSDGSFLSFFSESKWRRHGIDPSSIAVQQTLKIGKVQVHHGSLADYPENMPVFDVVTYLDALPFSPQPREDLRKIYCVLKGDGYFAVEIPGFLYRTLKNVGPFSLLINKTWCCFSPINRHFFYYTNATLRKMLDLEGFEVVDEALEQAPFGESWILNFLNRIHFVLAKSIYRVSFKRINLAAKIIFLCRKKNNEN